MVSERRLGNFWNSFAGRMAVGVFLIHLTLVPLLFFVSLSIFERTFQEKFVDGVRNEAYLYASLIKHDFKANNIESAIAEHLDEALLSGGILSADFLSQEGIVIHPTIQAIDSNLIFKEDFFFGQDDNNIYHIAIPVIDDLTGKKLGNLRLGFDEQPTLDLINTAYYAGTIFGIAYMLISVLLVLFFGKQLSAPVSYLRDMAKLIASGNHSVDMQTDTQISEIKHLAQDLNYMRLALLRQHQEVVDRELRLQAIMDNVIEGIVVLYGDGTIYSFNHAAEKIFDMGSDDAVGKSMDILIPETYQKEVQSLLAKNSPENKNIWHELQGKRSDSVLFPMELAVSEIHLNQGRILTVLVRDVTERQKAEADLRKLSRAVESSSSSVIITNVNGIIEYINPKFTQTTGYTKKDVEGQTPRLLKSSDEQDLLYDEILKSLKSGGEWKGEMHNRRKDGTLYRNRASISCIKDANGDITHFISVNDDVTAEYELAEKLNHQASHDALTGLVNRREFEYRTQELLSSKTPNKTEHVLCFMDLDQFKIVNDTCGHAAGDELLRQISKILRSSVRESDTLARLGGDEFAVLMKHCSLSRSQRLANTVLEAIRTFDFCWEGQTFRVGVSIGLVAITGEAKPTLAELLAQADAACYMAKEAGRNCIHTYSKQADIALSEQQGAQWIERINQGIEEDCFCLYAQAVVPLNREASKQYELLIRLQDEQENILPPGAFLPSAERYNLMSELDQWVIKNAFKTLAAHPGFVKQIDSVSINISAQSLSDEGFPDFVITQLQANKIEGRKVCFEIKETVAIANLSAVSQFISRLKNQSCQFALDDFGGSLSSFGYLKRLPVHYLKIDGILVKNIVDDMIVHVMVKSSHDIGKAMGLQTIAKFVENNEIKTALKEIGINYAQGYGIEKPIHLIELLTSR
ncbi:MAG: EAL domain-containing protein [Burkholderiales bacterium]|nr:EAL domain-containing protein [Burkholderiales bacterium]